MTRIRVEHPDGTTDTLTHVKSKLIREFGKMDLGSLWAPRSQVNDLTLKEDEDEVFFEDVGGDDLYGGLLKDVERGGPAVELVVDSFERYAKEAQPTSAGDRKENVADDTIVNEAISDVSRLTAGTVSQLETGLTFVFSHATQGKKIRTVEEATPGEVAYKADKTVDYVNRIGADKSGSVTISPGNQNLDGKIKVKEKGGGKNISHLRMLGAGEGKHQLEVNVVPEADTASYENKVTYSSSWESGDRRVWGEPHVNKEATDVATLERQGLTLIEELNSSYVEVGATVKGVDVEFGDTVQVKKPKDNIDQALRIVEWKRVEDNEGVRYECTLSSRQKSRQPPDSKNRQDLERYNKGFEGSPVTMTAGGGRQPVTSTLDYEFDFYYPAEVEYEHRVKLFVKGLAYRAYSSGASSGGDHTHTVDVDHPEHRHSVTVDHPSHDHDVSVEHPDHSHTVTFESPNHTHDLSNQGQDASLGKTYGPDQSTFDDHQHIYEVGNNLTTTDSDSETSSNELGTTESTTSSTELGTSQTETTTSEPAGTTSETSDASGDHTHPADPGVIESFSGNIYYPNDCDVIVNGTAIGVSLGDGIGPFEQEVDLAGMLNPGQVNTIRISSDSLGHLQSHLDIDVYRQILGDG